MLRKIYLVSPGYFHKQQPASPEADKPHSKNNVTKMRRVKKAKQKQHPYNKWLRISEKLEDAQVQRKTLINEFRDFLKQVLPDTKATAAITPK
jgi:hypothetical protein